MIHPKDDEDTHYLVVRIQGEDLAKVRRAIHGTGVSTGEVVFRGDRDTIFHTPIDIRTSRLRLATIFHSVMEAAKYHAKRIKT